MITLGCDPEAFVRESFTEKAIPAPLIPTMSGSKTKPKTVKDGAILIDGMAVEFNINPAKTKAEWLANIKSVLGDLMNHLPGYMLDFTPIIAFRKDDLDLLDEHHFVLGCDVDFNAWTGQPNPRPTPPRSVRTSAGHIYIGVDRDLSPSQKESLVRHLDTCLYLPSRLWDTVNDQRQKYYGAPGCYRPKPYGLEYRVLSSLWLTSDILSGYIFDQTMWAVQQWLDGTSYEDKFEKFSNFKPQNITRFLMAKGAPACPALQLKSAA